MKERLHIKNFGPIKDAELEFGNFNVLIGEQATGKSTIAKLLAVCRHFPYIVDWKKDEWLEQNFIVGLNDWGLNESLKENSFLFYQNADYEFSCLARKVADGDKKLEQKDWIKIETSLEPKSQKFKLLYKEFGAMRGKLPNSNYPIEISVPSIFSQSDFTILMDNPFYLPAERGLQSIFSLGKSSIQNIPDSLFSQLADIDRIARMFNTETFIEPLQIAYKNEHGKGYVRRHLENEFFSLSNAATGYQSTIPIVLATKYYQKIRKKSKTFIIEEPEQNLFPTTQKKLVQYLVEYVNSNKSSVFSTTHSPYILTSLNNLIYAAKVGQEHVEEAEKVIERKYWMNGDEVSAYMMLPDGSCEDIMDREEGLLKAEKIDEVSRTLNKEFDTLLNIEFVKE